MAVNQEGMSKVLHSVRYSNRHFAKPAVSLLLIMALLLMHVSFRVAKVEAQSSNAVPMISSKGDRALAIKEDGTIYAWGVYRIIVGAALDIGISELELDDRTPNLSIYFSSRPLQVTDLKGIKEISAGGGHSLALRKDGTVWTWGSNDSGQLGDGTGGSWGDYSALPVQVSGLSDVVEISAGGGYSMALREDGTVWAWGDNSYGQLGSGTGGSWGDYSALPVQVSGLTGIVAVSAGAWHSLALKNDGTVWAWGNNSSGQLGDDISGIRDDYSSLPLQDEMANGEFGDLTPGTYSSLPVKVSGLTDVAAISAGSIHSLALKNDGTVCAWGSNWYGQLGDGTTVDRHTPVQIRGLIGVQAISAGGEHHSLALREDGTVWAWGDNTAGKLGDGTITRRLTPIQVSGLTRVVAVSAGNHHSLALRENGTVWAWGFNLHGRLGDGTTTSRNVPVQSLINLGRVTSPTDEIKIYVEGGRQVFDDPIVIQEGRTLVPMRAFFEAMRADVSWDPATRTAIGIRGGIEVRIPIDSIHPTVNQQRMTIDVPARIIDGRTYIPLRFVGEALGDDVGWDGDTRTITITRGDSV